MKIKISSIIFYVIIVLIVGWGIRWFMRKTVTPKMEFQTSEFLLTSNNKKMTINDLKGDVVIVSFFQTWCGPCIGEMYDFEKLPGMINSPKLKILCISDEDTGLINRLESRFAPGKILFAHTAVSLASLGIHVYPTTYLLNKKGEVVQSKLEGYNWLSEKDTITKLLAE